MASAEKYDRDEAWGHAPQTAVERRTEKGEGGYVGEGVLRRKVSVDEEPGGGGEEGPFSELRGLDDLFGAGFVVFVDVGLLVGDEEDVFLLEGRDVEDVEEVLWGDCAW